MSRKVKLLFRHPKKACRMIPAKTLAWKDLQGEMHYFEPGEEKGQWVYELPEAYARDLLSQQPDRYHLISPKELTIRTLNRKDLTSTFVKVKAVDNFRKFADAEDADPVPRGPQPEAAPTARPVVPPPVARPVVPPPVGGQGLQPSGGTAAAAASPEVSAFESAFAPKPLFTEGGEPPAGNPGKPPLE